MRVAPIIWNVESAILHGKVNKWHYGAPSLFVTVSQSFAKAILLSLQDDFCPLIARPSNMAQFFYLQMYLFFVFKTSYKEHTRAAEARKRKGGVENVQLKYHPARQCERWMNAPWCIYPKLQAHCWINPGWDIHSSSILAAKAIHLIRPATSIHFKSPPEF